MKEIVYKRKIVVGSQRKNTLVPIPAPIRDRFNLENGDEVEITINPEKEIIEIKPIKIEESQELEKKRDI